uniref:Uncharacterized protein n=2 Tax=Gopherus agassizii TaxID=38772 RepID=A0A452H6D7_9SAUR
MPLSEDLYGCEDPTHWRTVFDIYWDVLKAKGGRQKKLAELDKWYQEELPVTIAGRREKYLTQAEVVKLMEWKLARGKFRPRLQQLVATNSSETVESCTRKAFQLLPDVTAAITELSQLKAVGPATASVDTEKAWTPHRVEMCLWAWVVAQKLCPSLLQTLSSGGEKADDEADEDVRPTKKCKARKGMKLTRCITLPGSKAFDTMTHGNLMRKISSKWLGYKCCHMQAEGL